MELLLKNVKEEHLMLFTELAKALKFDIEKDTYDPHFVAKILKGDRDFAEGKGLKIHIDDLRK